MKIVPREELPSDYFEMMESEAHHDHPIVEDDNGVLRWQENPSAVKLYRDVSDLNTLIPIFWGMGYDKNSEVLRKFYRDIGYSLSGYWEILYWEANNEEADEYVPHVLVPADEQPTTAITEEWLRACTKLWQRDEDWGFTYKVQDTLTKIVYNLRRRELRMEQNNLPTHPHLLNFVVIGRPQSRDELIDMISNISFEPRENLLK